MNPFLNLLGFGDVVAPKASSKRCTKCDTIQPLSLFSKHKMGRDGLNPQCRQCSTERMRQYRKKLKSNEKGGLL